MIPPECGYLVVYGSIAVALERYNTGMLLVSVIRPTQDITGDSAGAAPTK